jgi:hypothetical protein
MSKAQTDGKVIYFEIGANPTKTTVLSSMRRGNSHSRCANLLWVCISNQLADNRSALFVGSSGRRVAIRIQASNLYVDCRSALA